MKCPQCKGRKYIELDKIGLVTCACPGCDGTGEVTELVTGAVPLGETDTTEGYANADDIPSELASHTITNPSGDTLTIPSEIEVLVKSNADGELLNDFEGVLNGNINGDNKSTGGGDTSEPIVTQKPTVKRRTRKKTR